MLSLKQKGNVLKITSEIHININITKILIFTQIAADNIISNEILQKSSKW